MVYGAECLGRFEFWTMKQGADGLTRISVRVSGQGQRESWLVPSDEAEADVLKRWADERIERLGFRPPWASGDFDPWPHETWRLSWINSPAT